MTLPLEIVEEQVASRSAQPRRHRRLFQVKLQHHSFKESMETKEFRRLKTFSIIETFIAFSEEREVFQLLSVAPILEKGEKKGTPLFSKAVFRSEAPLTFQQVGPRKSIESEEYYSILLSQKNDALEQKMRYTFTGQGRDYALEHNEERDYSVIQIEGDIAMLSQDELFEELPFVVEPQELSMSFEESFFRLYLPKFSL